MAKLKDLTWKKKNFILIIFAVLLIIFTAYQLKFIGITITDDANIIKINEVSKAESEATLTSNLEENEVLIENKIINNSINLEENEVLIENKIINNSINLEETEKLTEVLNVEANTVITSNLKGTDESEKNVENTIINNSTNIIEDENETEKIVEEIPSELVFDNGEYKVTVEATTKDALKNIKDIKVTPITSQTDAVEYNKISDKLYNKLEEENLSKSEKEQKNIAGFLAYDITLINNNNEEIEPDGNVNVSIEYIKVPEEVVKYVDAEVSVVHFEKNKLNGEISLQEYSQDNQNLKVETNNEQQIKKIEFETDSFSTFTITWMTNQAVTYLDIIVHYVDSQGNEIQGPQQRTIYASENKRITLSDYAGNIEGYLYDSAHFNVLGGSVITSIDFEVGPDAVNNEQSIQNITFFNGQTEVANIDYNNDRRNVNVYLVYTEIGRIVITDNIANDGNLHSIFTDIEGNEIEATYTWYRAESQYDNNPIEIERVKITGTTYNISSDGKKLNVALDRGADKWYFVVARTENGEVFTSDRYHVPYYDEVRNGDFESPNLVEVNTGAVSGWGDKFQGMIKQYSVGTPGLIWRTTGSDKTVEIGRNGIYNNSVLEEQYYNPDGAYKGLQFGELNSEASGALYQDILTIPGQQLNWELAHRGREGVDTMYVVIMSTKDAQRYDVTTQEKVNYILENKEEFPGVSIRIITDGNDKWGFYKGYYNVPINQYLTRFFFVAGDTASQDDTVGNFIDEIRIGQDIRPATPGIASVTVRKIIVGIDNTEDLPNLLISENNNLSTTPTSKNYGNFIWDTNNKIWYLEQTFEISTDKYSSVEAFFTEQNPENYINGYNFVSAEYKFEEEEYKDLIVGKDGYHTEQLVLNENQNYVLLITNTYEKLEKDFSFEKYAERIGNGLKGAEFTLSNQSGFSTKITSDDNGIVTFTNVPYGNYTLTETKIPDNFKISANAPTSYNVIVNESGVTIEYIDAGNNSVSISSDDFNVINELDLTSITLNKKTVWGSLLSGASFSITENGKADPQQVISEDEDGIFVFENIKYDTIYIIREVSSPNDNKYYKMNSEIQVSVSKETGRITIKNSSNSEIAKLVSLDEDGKTLNVINIKHTEMPKAGGMGVYWFYILGTVIMISTVIVYNKKIKFKERYKL